MSALSVLAERPSLISHLVLTAELSALGAYQFRFCKNGQWRTVTVDDHVPVYSSKHSGGGGGGGGGHIAFSHCPSHCLWVSLLEKGYAKLHGSYGAVESGSLFEALGDLTGAPCERLELHTEAMSRYGTLWNAAQKGDKQLADIIWAQILLARASKFLLGASCGRKVREETL